MSRLSRSACLAAVLAAIPMAARAQDAGAGFLFEPPLGSLTIRGGWALARAHSDLFSFTTSQLSLNRGDFSSPSLGADLDFRILPRTSVVISAELSGMDKKSDFRGFIDNNDLPIEQTTSFRRIPVTLGVKQYLTSTGRSIGKFAWIPTRFAPYVGVAGGMMYYRFRQSGDFIDFNTTSVFPDTYMSDGWALTTHAMAGVDYSLGARFALTTEARYLWSSAELSNDFSGFHALDLSGLSTTVGFSVRF
ncbi:MAG TPA: hypothetical protein VK636_22755 [Gemmatimonadaceae bacterium]|nr:hypothetical protein [Gemmatimonadaceae bacterium]